jgi:hypothetical protein
MVLSSTMTSHPILLLLISFALFAEMEAHGKGDRKVLGNFPPEELFFRLPISAQGCDRIAAAHFDKKSGVYEQVAVEEIQDPRIARELLLRRYGLESKNFEAVVLDDLFRFSGGKDKFPVLKDDPEFEGPRHVTTSEFRLLQDQVGSLITKYLDFLHNKGPVAAIKLLKLFRAGLDKEPTADLPNKRRISDLIAAFKTPSASSSSFSASVLQREVAIEAGRIVHQYYDRLFEPFGSFSFDPTYSAESLKFRKSR